MELQDNGTEGTSQMKLIVSPLICGLPDDIALYCLARVPRKYHMILKGVSKRWRNLVCSEEWVSYRQKNNLSESWIYALCRDRFQQVCCYVLDPKAPRKYWKLLEGLPLPPRSLKRKGMAFEALGKKLYLLGGCGWFEDPTDEVYCYDASLNSWSEATPLSTSRCYFTSQALNGKMYAIGGLGARSTDAHTFDTYDPQTNTWTTHLDLKIVPDIGDSIVFDGKLYIRPSTSALSSPGYAVVHEPSSGVWQLADADMASGWSGPGVTVDGTFYVLDQTSGTRLMMWRKDSREWLAVGRLSPLLTRPPCQLVSIETNIFVIGRGLSTVVIDVAQAGKMEGVLLGSSIPRFTFADEDVLSCKCLAI